MRGKLHESAVQVGRVGGHLNDGRVRVDGPVWLVGCAVQALDFGGRRRIRRLGGNSMSSQRCVAAALAALVLVPVPLVESLALGDESCREYATAAVRQVGEMHAFAACNRVGGPRWSGDWNFHYRWCRGVSSFEEIGAERDARTNWLRSCTGR